METTSKIIEAAFANIPEKTYYKTTLEILIIDMNYAIKTLSEERDRINNALSNWEKEKYPEAKNEREKRIRELDTAMKLIDKSK